MRFMLLVIPKGYENAPAGQVPDVHMLAKMRKHNEAMQQAGILLSLDGLHPPVEATRLRFDGGKPVLTDGPFPEAKEVVGGYWLIDVKSKDEAVAWASRAPMLDGDMIEVRQVQDIEEWPEAVKRAARGDNRMQATPAGG